MLSENHKNNISIYIHWPFCEKKCPYCDFNSYEVKNTIDSKVWRKAYEKEINREINRSEPKKIRSIFFGGGTPSLMSCELIEFILKKFNKFWIIDKDTEITLEANPSSSMKKYFSILSTVGVNRLSLGFQSINDKTLKFLGRNHTSKESMKGLEIAKKYFNRVSIDLIYGTPNQTVDEWDAELENILKISGEHISAYQLTIEKGTEFYTQFKNNKFSITRDTTLVNLYNHTDKKLSDCRYNKYETSNYSLPGAECRHNLDIWQGKQYLGIGPGAHGRVIRQNKWYATYKFPNPNNWLEKTLNANGGLLLDRKLSNAERKKEIFLTSLRLTGGLDFNKLKYLTDKNSMEEIYDKKALVTLHELGLLKFNKSKIYITSKGFPLLNSILNKILY